MDDDLLLRENTEGFVFWCPACSNPHMVWTKEANPVTGARWVFNGDLILPTFSPSINICIKLTVQEQKRCHFFIRAGQIEYCSDCSHEMAGKIVPMVSFRKALDAS